MVVVKQICYMHTFTSLGPEVNVIIIPFFLGTANLHWCPLVPMKFQVGKLSICLGIRDLRRWLVQLLAHQCDCRLEIHAFCGAIYKKIQAKSSMRVDPFSMRVLPEYRMVPKASSKVILTASELPEFEI